MSRGSVHKHLYATGFRADRFEAALSQIDPIALRYGATSYHVYRYRDDRYKFLQVVEFDDKLDWERYWGGPEFERFRTIHNGWYQVPIVYQWADTAASGAMPQNGGNGNGAPAETGAIGDTI